MVSADRLILELDQLGLHFLVGQATNVPRYRMSPDKILAGLAKQKDARLRMAIIPLFLFRPDFVQVIPESLKQLKRPDQQTLMLFYTAAVFLQQIYLQQLQVTITQWQSLPDLFSNELDIPKSDNPQNKLRILSERHRALSGLSVNWLGAYQYAANRLIKHLEKEATWAV